MGGISQIAPSWQTWTPAFLGALLSAALGAQGPAAGRATVPANSPTTQRDASGPIGDPQARPASAARESQGAAPGQRQLLDKVELVIGDRVVLESAVRRELDRSLGGRQLTDAERGREELEIMRQMAREEIWRQVGKVLGAEDPQRFDRMVEKSVDDYIDERIAEFGSHAEMDRELLAAQTSWEALRAEHRSRVLRDAARGMAIRSRFGDDSGLMVTPREMLRYYRAHPEEFAAVERADVAWMSFPANRRDDAELARAAWENEPLAAVDTLAERFGGSGRVVRDVTQDEADSNLQLIKDFAIKNQPGTVSGLEAFGSRVYVMRLLDRQSRESKTFSDPEAQAYIRRNLAIRKRMELEERILAWKSQSIVIEPPELFRRR